MEQRVLIIGVGGLGGNIAGSLLAAGHDVTALTTNQGVIDAVAEHGFRLTGMDDEQVVPGRAVAQAEGEPFEWIILAVPPTAVEQAARDALPWLAEEGAMVVLQNGLCEHRVAEVAGPERVLGCVVIWGASMPEPGVFERTSHGPMMVGRLDGRDDPRLAPLAELLSCCGPVEVTDNLAGTRWSKLSLNCMVSTLGTLRGDRLGKVLLSRTGRRLGLALIGETMDVALAQGVRPPKLAGVDLVWLSRRPERLPTWLSLSMLARHTVMIVIGLRYRRMRSSMLSAIERGRTPPIDYLNGEVSRHGRALGVSTPLSDAVVERVWAISRGEMKSGAHQLEALRSLL